MPSRRVPRAMVLAVAAVVAVASVSGSGPRPALAAEGSRGGLEQLRAARDGRPPSLRGVLAGIGRSARLGHLRRTDLAGLITRRNAAGATLVAVSIRTHGPVARALLSRLADLGVEVANRDASAVEAYLLPSLLDLVASLPGVAAVEPILPTSLTALVGAGVSLHRAGAWQSAGYLATGVKVGIIDGGFTGMAARLGTELPATVHARCYTGVGAVSSDLAACEAEGIDHGTGVAETIVDMAPGVDLYVANPLSLQDYQRTVTWMTSNGVRIINASLATAYQGPGDGTDPTGASLYTVVAQASAAGALWVNSAGNSGESGWVGPWTDPDGDGFLNWVGDDAENGIELSAGQQVIVTARWNDPWGRSGNDYDIGVFDAFGDLIAASVDTQDGNDDPVETLVFEAPASGEYNIVATRHLGAPVSRFQVLVLTSGLSPLEHRVAADTIPSPVDSRATGFLAVGAVDVASPQAIQTYSSRGPTVDNRIRPDLVAGDCGPTTALGIFCGTSQSAPHVSGAAALVLDAMPTSSNAQIAAYLRGHAVRLGPSSPNNTFGYGRLDLGAPPAPPTPVGLAIQAQPGGGIEGSPLTTQPAVRIVDGNGTTVANGPGATLAVTLSLGGNVNGALLACDGGLTRNAIAGVATFAGCTVDRAGAGYTLLATAPSLAPATSAPFTVTGAPVVLAFSAAPADGAAGSALGPAPVVRVTNGAGGIHATGPWSTTPVTLSIGGNGDAATLTCSGGTTVAAVAGVAMFSGCSIDVPGGGFTLVATAIGAVTATSAPFTLADPAGLLTVPSLAVLPDAGAIRWGTSVRLEVRLASPDGRSVASRAVRLQRTSDGIEWADITTPLLTDAAGVAIFDYRPAVNHWYRAAFAAGDGLAAATSASSRVTVRQLALLRPTNGGTVKVVPRRTQVAFRTTVRPASAAVPPGDVTLLVYQQVAGRWTLTSTEVATPDAAGVATIFVTFSSPGKWYVRSQANPTPVNANSGWSPIERYDVR